MMATVNSRTRYKMPSPIAKNQPDPDMGSTSVRVTAAGVHVVWAVRQPVSRSGGVPSDLQVCDSPAKRASPAPNGHCSEPAWGDGALDGVLLVFRAGFLRRVVSGVRRMVLGGRRRRLTGRAGSAGTRKAATRRATRVARNTWPASASMTAMARPLLLMAVKSP